MKRRTRLRPRSRRREKIDAERREFVRSELSKRIYCEAGGLIGAELGQLGRWSSCFRMSSELHEPLTRARAPGAETILDPDNSVAVCRACHQWIHEHPAKSTELGLLRRSR